LLPQSSPQLSTRSSGAVHQLRFSGLGGAVGAAEEPALDFSTVSDDPAPAMRTGRRQSVNGTLEAIEGVVLSAEPYLKSLVVVVAAIIADRHRTPPRYVMDRRLAVSPKTSDTTNTIRKT